MRQNAKKTLNTKTGNAINKSTRIKANLSKKSIDKLTSGKALHKSISNGFSAEEHFKAVEKIKSIFRKASLKSSKPDKNNDINIDCIKRFSASYKTCKGNDSSAYITVKCYKNGLNKLYSLELLK